MRKVPINVVLALGLVLGCSGDDSGTTDSGGTGTDSSAETGPTTDPSTSQTTTNSGSSTTDTTTESTTASTTDTTTDTGTGTVGTDSADTGTADTGLEGCGEGEMWAENSCMKPPKKIGMVPEAGCYQTCQGDPNECDMGLTCQPVWIETTCPCPPWEQICCDGCGGSVVTLCLP